jgi:hypothetical protein
MHHGNYCISMNIITVLSEQFVLNKKKNSFTSAMFLIIVCLFGD